MEERRPPRERELVLAPNEFAYILDTTKGHINCYVGPNKTSLALTDELVIFDEQSKRFERVNQMPPAIQIFATAPANWYLVLKNPAKGDLRPSSGVSAVAPPLHIGTKVNIPGPVSFPLWPGQMARVIEGHRLRTNQYLVVAIFDAVRAESAREALGIDADRPIIVGEKFVVRGTNTSYFMPPDGVEVVCDENDAFIRNAVTLQRLEYCVLVGEDGVKHYLRGEAVVFPEPHQRFLERNGRRTFQAVELSSVTGIHVKVIAGYDDTDEGEPVRRKEGDELFITGDNRVYFPRAEHAVIKTEGRDLHHAVAIPRGEGRYVLDRKTGEVRMALGPTMLLPDPRREVVVRRVLTPRECHLMYPGNVVVHAMNLQLKSGRTVPGELPMPVAPIAGPFIDPDNDHGEFRREPYKAPRTITLDTRHEGVVSVDVWSGYAVQVVDRVGGRRVVQGPSTVHLNYDETLEALALSMGTPKSTKSLLDTSYLQLTGNKVSDVIDVTTSDLVRMRVSVKYRVNFEGDDSSKWFAVDNYVQLLVDHASSIILATAQKQTIHALRRTGTEIVRDAILGAKTEGSARKGLAFVENAMRIYDVEVLSMAVLDADVEKVLLAAERRAIGQAVELSERETRLSVEGRRLEIERLLQDAAATARIEAFELQEKMSTREHSLKTNDRARTRSLLEEDRERERVDAELTQLIRRLKLDSDLEAHTAQLRRKKELQDVDLARLSAEVDGMVKQASAWSPQLVATLQRMGDEHFLSSISENFSELAAVEGRGVLETARKFLDFIPTSMVPQLRARIDAEPIDDG